MIKVTVRALQSTENLRTTIGIRISSKSTSGRTLPPSGPSNEKKRAFTIGNNRFRSFFSPLNFRQQYKYEDITPARKEFLEKQDEKNQTKRQEADLSYWAQVSFRNKKSDRDLF